MNFFKRKLATLSLLALAILFTSCDEENSNVGVDYNTIKIDFESVELPGDGVLGGKDENGSHEIGVAEFAVTYNEEYELLQDYQNRINGGEGFLRLLRFYPDQGKIQAVTYSTWLNTYEVDEDSYFQIDFNF